MNKVKRLIILNVISYILMLFILYIQITNIFANLNIFIKFIIGISPYVMVICTSFILARDINKEFNNFKMKSSIDWITRIIAFSISINAIKYIEKYYLIVVCIIFLFICNCFIEYSIYKRIGEVKIEAIEKVIVSYEEKYNLRKMFNAVNSSSRASMLFCGIGLSVPASKNMEGTTMWYIPVITSVIVFVWYMKIINKNFMLFYLDKKYAKEIINRNIFFIAISYSLCLIMSFINLSYNTYSLITLLGIILQIPVFESIRKMALRLKKIENSMGKESYNYFINEAIENN